MKTFKMLSSNFVCFMKQDPLRRIVGLTTIVGGLALTQGFAKEPVEREAQPDTTAQSTGAATAEAAIPACLAKLKLTQAQQTQAREIVRKYVVKLESARNQFGEKYTEMVRTEVSLLAAIEDNLTEPQRTQIREQRHKTAHSEKVPHESKAKQDPASGKPADAAEQEIADAGVTLTSEQEAAADRIHHRYLGRLRSLNRDIYRLHTRLVALEADKLVELEKLLTKEQLVQLREARGQGTDAPRVSAAEKDSSSTE